MLQLIIRHRRMVWILAIRQIRDRYAGTIGGAIWAVLNPLLLLLVFWVVFGVGLRMGSETGRPFVLVLFCGLVPWMTFSEALNGAASSITGRAYLVKKIAFPLEILPVTHLLAALFTHGVLLLILAIILAAYQVVPGIGILLLPYYLLAMCALASGLSMLLAAVVVFYRDVLQGLGVFLNIWFWLTPIVWPPEMVSARLQPLLNLNPLNYVISGYRESLLAPQPVLPDVMSTVYFWGVVTVLWFLGSGAFRRLKHSFADVL